AGDEFGEGDDAAEFVVDGNSVSAQARGNNALNDIRLDAAGTIGATSAIDSQQSLVSSGTGVQASVADVQVELRAGEADLSDITVSDNQVAAIASGNSVGNAIEAGAAALNASPVEAFATADASAGTAVATYAINNGQANDAA